MQIHRQTLLFRYERFYQLLSLVFRHEERHVIHNHTMLTPIPNVRHISWCFRSQFISTGRDPKNSTLRLNGRIPNYSTPWSNLNFQLALFQNPQILRTISSRHDIIHTPAPLSLWGLS